MVSSLDLTVDRAQSPPTAVQSQYYWLCTSMEPWTSQPLPRSRGSSQSKGSVSGISSEWMDRLQRR